MSTEGRLTGRPLLPPPSFRRSLGIQMRVIGALLMREVITRFGRENIGVLWLMGEPMLFTLGVAGVWTAAGLHKESGLPIIAFAITGYSTVLMWRNTVSRCNAALNQNLSLLYHRNVQPIDVIAARIILEMSGATASFSVLSVFFIAIGSIHVPDNLLKVAAGWLMLAWFSASLGLLMGAATAYSEFIDRVWHIVAYLLFPLSGAVFMVDWLTPNVQKFVLLLPMVHGVEMIREGYFGNLVKPHHDMAYMAACNLALTLSGLLLIRRAADRLETR